MSWTFRPTPANLMAGGDRDPGWDADRRLPGRAPDRRRRDGQRLSRQGHPERDARFRERFLRESRIAADLHHPNVTRTLGSGEADGLLYLAMAYVDGPDLRELLRRDGRFDPARAVAVVSQIAG